MLKVRSMCEGHEKALLVGVKHHAVADIVVKNVVGRLSQCQVCLESPAEVACIAAPPHADHEAHVRRLEGRPNVEG